MRYLKLTRCDGIYDYVPLDNVEFHFNEIDEREYRIELSIGGHHITTIEKLNRDPDMFIEYISVIQSHITTFEELLYCIKQ
jgi:hypothetical protein